MQLAINDSKTAPHGHLAAFPVKVFQLKHTGSRCFFTSALICHRILVCGSLNACLTQRSCLSNRNRRQKQSNRGEKKKPGWCKLKCEEVKRSLVTRFRKCYTTYLLLIFSTILNQILPLAAFPPYFILFFLSQNLVKLQFLSLKMCIGLQLF